MVSENTPPSSESVPLLVRLVNAFLFKTMGKSNLSKADFKDGLSGLRHFLANEIHLKMMKNAFYFALKVPFVLKIFKFLF